MSPSGLVRDSCIIISEDCEHDYHAVNHFTKLVDERLEQVSKCKPEKKVVFSDRCSAQYKSKGPFADVSLTTVRIDRNFFG